MKVQLELLYSSDVYGIQLTQGNIINISYFNLYILRFRLNLYKSVKYSLELCIKYFDLLHVVYQIVLYE